MSAERSLLGLSRPNADVEFWYSLTHLSHSTPYSITSSAVASSVGGMVRLSVFAVLRLMISSTVVGCWIGKSLTFVPLRNRQVFVDSRSYCRRQPLISLYFWREQPAPPALQLIDLLVPWVGGAFGPAYPGWPPRPPPCCAYAAPVANKMIALIASVALHSLIPDTLIIVASR
jgi:hypothetical protein